MRKNTDLNSAAKYIWNGGTPKKISFFMWRLINNILPFEYNLKKIGIIGPFKCPFCNHEDTIDHYFMQCHTSSRVWLHFGNILNFQINLSSSLIPFLHLWYNDYKGSVRELSFIIPNLICWQLWKIRNNLLYDDNTTSYVEAVAAITNELFQLSVAKPLSRLNNHLPAINICTVPRTNKPPIKGQWLKPPASFIKISLATRPLSDSILRTGILIRNAKGVYIAHST
ncbi:unnamed protein product, partial [Cuscuta epithymum]